jgi:hypothetical protein
MCLSSNPPPTGNPVPLPRHLGIIFNHVECLRCAQVSEETYCRGKRDLIRSKRDLLSMAYLKYAQVSEETYCRGKRDRQKRHTKFKRFLLSQVYLAAREEAGHAHQSTNLYIYIYIYICIYIYPYNIYIYILFNTWPLIGPQTYIHICMYIYYEGEGGS